MAKRLKSSERFTKIRDHVTILIKNRKPNTLEDVKKIFRLTCRKFLIAEEEIIDVWNITAATFDKLKM